MNSWLTSTCQYHVFPLARLPFNSASFPGKANTNRQKQTKKTSSAIRFSLPSPRPASASTSWKFWYDMHLFFPSKWKICSVRYQGKRIWRILDLTGLLLSPSSLIIFPPPLVIAYAIAGTIKIDFEKEPLGKILFAWLHFSFPDEFGNTIGRKLMFSFRNNEAKNFQRFGESFLYSPIHS